MTSKPLDPLLSGMNMAGACVLAMWYPVFKWRDSDPASGTELEKFPGLQGCSEGDGSGVGGKKDTGDWEHKRGFDDREPIKYKTR